MKTIYKYTIPNCLGAFELDMPKSAQILNYQMQGEEACIWAMVDTAVKRETRKFRVVGTGSDLSVYESEMATAQYIGTVQEKVFVWHLFEILVGSYF